MKTRTATSDMHGSTQQAASVLIPGRLARAGFTALALTAASMGIFGAGSASADERGNPADAAVVSGPQVAPTGAGTPIALQNADDGRIVPGPKTTVASARAKVKAAPSGQGTADDADCDAWASVVESYLELADEALARGDANSTIDYAEMAEAAESKGMDAGCFFY
jgi:hypothetical protein